ncbi:hypothetical protein GCM10009527_042440 [Actinomadura nitritigenes]|uniref:Uncharacterized protein n=1 Tax=Actinomadura nitritigenes TaxID=134602 RepID=A0ABS3R2L6_9ACTN|nr:hypothetical protein [Actinomadura nitritigenes]MBO2440252.1 hypothetical protein [Actinomadura nitritigenes]
MTSQHPDPIAEGFSHGGERMIQIVAMAAALKQSHARRAARLRAAELARDAAAERTESAAQQAAFAEARSRWVRAHDRQWLQQAGLLGVAEAWGAAIPYTANSSSAAAAVRKCENRLRDLHPHAMSHYDRARTDGMEPLDAMRKAAPFFICNPNVRTGEPATPRPALAEGNGAEWAATIHGPHRTDWENARRQQRAHLIADQHRERQLGPDELRTVLETTTNLPDKVIAEVAPVVHSTQARLAAEGFPFTIDQALEISAKRPFEPPAARKPATQTPDRNRRRNL